jgi:hypothetical protein
MTLFPLPPSLFSLPPLLCSGRQRSTATRPGISTPVSHAKGQRPDRLATKSPLSHPIYKNINRAIIYAPGSSHAYIQQIIKISQHMSRIK